ncbi:DUF3737 family protein [Lacticaseibacillus sharpeae]|uniref:Hydrogenase-4 component C n=1 Tax=Lacticaseibacillus sharpeae JCM 1186 = DSM 20505 TaxID=1291052 RepID=A0A0R1ZKG5_9LACO|nr:DUF3737 family protein [Lacticaseibacillus sharpeae]KRM55437.1 hypothetical protein FC18_GL001332 [Lacticaseibacillus sharpeae JCM 1186 = DSM 20505]
MTNYNEQLFTGERALFMEHDAHITNSTFDAGESPLKESQNIELDRSIFKWKYPLWYSNHVQVKNSIFETMSRSGIWYTSDITIKDSTIQAPKQFRRSNHIVLTNVHFADAEETLWNCGDITLDHVQATGDYFGMNSHDIKIDHLDLVGNYAFDGGRNIEVHNSRIVTKDAFWNCENVTIYDSTISGEYLAWNTKNLRLVNCTIESDQGLCYIDGLTMENCQLLNTDLAFEYCQNINATISTHIDSVKNPISGTITAPSIGQVIQDDPAIDTSAVTINTTDYAQAG